MKSYSTTTLRLLIEERLSTLIPPMKGPSSLLYKAARHSLFLPGKRLRPLFLLNVLQDYGVSVEKGLDVAVALEMIHTYSLIHDDLPCMDNQPFRKGKPTLHRIYGEGHAVLAGDFLLTSAFEILGKSQTAPEVIALIGKTAGGKGMVGGQVIDLIADEKNFDQKILLSMYLKKTAALFSAALECGAMISGASLYEQRAFRRVGKYFGIAYQIRDDILDQAEEKKPNCLTLYNTKQAQKWADYCQEKTLRLLPKKAYHVQNQLRTSFILNAKAIELI